MSPSATDQVIAELRGSGLPLEAQAFLLTVFGGEVGNRAINPWTVLFGFTYWTGSLVTFPEWNGVLLPSGLRTTAAGAFQITHTTWGDWANLPGAPQDYGPQAQIHIAWLGASDRYTRRSHGRDLGADLRAALVGEVAMQMGGTWPGGMSKFRTRFPQAVIKLQAGPPPPPPPLPVETMLFSGVDATGRSVQIIERISPLLP